jgi:hypothetical protein
MAAVLDDAVYNPHLKGIVETVPYPPVSDLVTALSGHGLV